MSARRLLRTGLGARLTSTWPAATQLPAINRRPAQTVDEALDGIRARQGVRTNDFVAMQLEYAVRANRTDHDDTNAVDRSESKAVR